ncbi:MAG: hypothetical protein BroJett018_06050 [Chloroflexota bacterium]|nr:hypothetical protein [Chloroflexota bacterium]NOG63001.1 hypothetical protein [Chloroflexota bacterium]GIK62811.1 MAG: hypothetical protein BroJett018_06050 [Chloroflexota bacterium]
MEINLLVNTDKAYEYSQTITGPVVKQLVEFAHGLAMMQFVKLPGMSDEEYQEQLPEKPLDMLFYIKLMEKLFSQKENVRLGLAGENIKDFPY